MPKIDSLTYLPNDKSIVLERVHCEHMRRRRLGLPIDIDSLCQLGPNYRSSIIRQVQVDQYCEENPEFVSLLSKTNWPESGDEFQGFKLLRDLGEGSFARVFLAEEPSVGDRLVVLKVSPFFHSESHLLGNLKHDGIIPVHSANYDHELGMGFVCMPFVGFATLLDFQRAIAAQESSVELTEKLIEEVAAGHFDRAAQPTGSANHSLVGRQSFCTGILSILADVADALQYAHDQEVCHGDIKPSNVLLSFEGRAVLMDFNLAFRSDIRSSHFGGTVAYMAPELLEIVADERKPRGEMPSSESDVFSFGILAHELLTLSQRNESFSDHSTTNDFSAALLQQYRDLPARLELEGVPNAVAQIVRDCLNFDPDQRPTAEVVASTLRACVSQRSRRRRWVVRHPLKSLAIAATVAAAAYFFPTVHEHWSESRADRFYQSGRIAFEQHNYSRAFQDFDLACQYGTRFDGAATLARARSEMAVSRWEEASHDFKDCVDHGVFVPEAYAGLAYCYAQLARFDDAKSYGVNAIEQGYKTAEVYNNLGSCYQAQRFEAPARVYLTQAWEKNPRLASAANNLGLLELETAITAQQHPSNSIRYFEKAIEVTPDAPNVLWGAAIAYAHAHEMGESHQKRIEELLFAARQHGFDADAIRSNPILRHVLGDARLGQIAARTAETKAANLPVFVDPLASASLLPNRF